MKAYALILLATSSLSAFGQNTISPEDLAQKIDNYVGDVYWGCPGTDGPNPKERIVRDPVSKEEMDVRVDYAKSVFDKYYQDTFSKSPDLKKKIFEDLEAIGNDKECQKEGNDCRATFVATAKAYIDYIRPNLPACHKFEFTNLSEAEQNRIKSEISMSGMNYAHRGSLSENTRCKLEQDYKDKPYKLMPIDHPGSRYNEKLVDLANQAAVDIAENMLKAQAGWKTEKIKDENGKTIKIDVEVKDYQNALVCDRTGYSMRIKAYEHGNYWSSASVSSGKKQVVVAEPKECIEEKITLMEEFVPTNFEEGRSEVGQDQTEPVKQKILDFINSDSNLVVTDVTVVASSSKTPFSKYVDGKKIIDPDSNVRNLKLAQERADFASKIFDQMKSSSETLSKIKFEIKPLLSGPEFDPADSTLKLSKNTGAALTTFSKGAQDQFNKNQLSKSQEDIDKMSEVEKASYQMFKKQADPLTKPTDYPTLYHAKFKPYQGFQIKVSGYKKSMMKCSDSKDSKSKKSGATSNSAQSQ